MTLGQAQVYVHADECIYTDAILCISMHEQGGAGCSGTEFRGYEQILRTAISNATSSAIFETAFERALRGFWRHRGSSERRLRCRQQAKPDRLFRSLWRHQGNLELQFRALWRRRGKPWLPFECSGGTEAGLSNPFEISGSIGFGPSSHFKRQLASVS